MVSKQGLKQRMKIIDDGEEVPTISKEFLKVLMMMGTESVLKFLARHGVIYNKVECSKCYVVSMSLVKLIKRSDGLM